MKKKSLRFALLSLLVIGSLASHLFINTSAASQFPSQPNPNLRPQTEAEKTDDSREIVLPDVTVIQKIIKLAERILARN